MMTCDIVCVSYITTHMASNFLESLPILRANDPAIIKGTVRESAKERCLQG
jgi:hypothetical protein